MPREEQDSVLSILSEPQLSDPQAAEGTGEPGPVSAADVAMLGYAAKLTLDPGSIGRADVEALREHGFDDRAIHDICAVASYYAFVNRIADGLGVELEPRW